jgi:hypothetical protein
MQRLNYFDGSYSHVNVGLTAAPSVATVLSDIVMPKLCDPPD